jgi:thioredoxin-related protein
MNRNRKLAAFAGIFLCFLAVAGIEPACAAAGPDRINWYGYQEGRAVSEKEAKKLFLYFWSKDCAFCEQMDKETLRAPEVADFLNRHFISIRVNAQDDRRITAEYRVVGFPTSYFLTEKGSRIGALPGYMEAKRFLAFLRFLASESYLKMSFSDFLKK